MTTMEHLLSEVRSLPEQDLLKVSDYLAFIKYRSKPRRRTIELPDDTTLQSLYSDCSAEDRELSEMGIVDYHTSLDLEDKL